MSCINAIFAKVILMKFVIEMATNCDPKKILSTKQEARDLVAENTKRAVAKCCASFFCLCCCVKGPITSSAILNNMNELGFPPAELKIAAKDEIGHNSYGVISSVITNPDGSEKRIPLLFSANTDVIQQLAQELEAVYLKSYNLLTESVDRDELDEQAGVWHRLFNNLPEKSNPTQQLEINQKWARSMGAY